MKKIVCAISFLFSVSLYSQNVGIGTSTPQARLHVADSNVLFSGPLTLPVNPGNPPASGAGARMMWYADKAAFRAGMVEGLESIRWGKDSIGQFSFASGYNNSASGPYAAAFGDQTIASGFYSFATGKETKAIGSMASAIGFRTLASGFASFAWGELTTASSVYATAMGKGTIAAGGQSTAMGFYTKASGTNSTALGNNTIAKAHTGTSIGSYNDDLDNPAVFSQPTDRIFQLGNGDESTRSNAITVLRNGHVGIGTTSPGDILEVNGRVYLRSLPGNTAGLWFDNTFSNFKSAFIGMQSDNRIGIYGGDGAGWAFTVNTQNGRVGVGTTSAQNPLDVVAGPSSTATKLIVANRGGFGPAAIEFVSDYGLSSQWRPGYIASNDNGGFTGKLEFFTNGTGSNNLYGAVKGLEVRNGAALTATGSVGSFSDARLKNNIEPFTDGLNVIEQINPVQFQYNADAPFASPDKQVGIVAQELEKVAPYMVHQTTERNVKDMRWVDNQAYVFLLINAVKELQHKVELQQVEIEKLKRKRK